MLLPYPVGTLLLPLMERYPYQNTDKKNRTLVRGVVMSSVNIVQAARHRNQKSPTFYSRA